MKKYLFQLYGIYLSLSILYLTFMLKFEISNQRIVFNNAINIPS